MRSNLKKKPHRIAIRERTEESREQHVLRVRTITGPFIVVLYVCTLACLACYTCFRYH